MIVHSQDINYISYFLSILGERFLFVGLLYLCDLKISISEKKKELANDTRTVGEMFVFGLTKITENGLKRRSTLVNSKKSTTKSVHVSWSTLCKMLNYIKIPPSLYAYMHLRFMAHLDILGTSNIKHMLDQKHF